MNAFKSWSELSPLEQAACEFSDFYKEANGFRPRHIDTSSWSLEDFDREFAVLARICKENAHCGMPKRHLLLFALRLVLSTSFLVVLKTAPRLFVGSLKLRTVALI